MSDEHEDVGGRYAIDKGGKRKRVDEPQKVPEGGGARDSKGRLLFTEPPAEHNTDSMPAPAGKPWDAPAAAEPASSTSSKPAADKGSI